MRDDDNVKDMRPRCEHLVVYPEDNCPSCMTQRIAELESERSKIFTRWRNAEAALERVRGLPQYTAHVFADTETRSDGERTRPFRIAKVVLADKLAAALKEEENESMD